MTVQPERGRIVAARYRLDSILGEGGMAVVWRATHTETDRAVALKLVRGELVTDDAVRDMFVREARVAARIGANRHIVDVLDAGLDAELGVPFIAMELLRGEPLDARIRRQGPVPSAFVLDWVVELADALDQAHAAGVFHRDLKPQNLFLALDKRQRTELKVLDFGIAKLAESVQQSSTHVGTPAYSAPEQLGPSWRTLAEQRGKSVAAQVSAATDVWSMGLVVYEMLIGSPSGSLWGATTLAELPVKIVLEPPPVPSQRAGARAALLPPGFDAWAARCLDLDATKRFASAGQAADAIVKLLRAAPAHTTQSVPPPARDIRSVPPPAMHQAEWRPAQASGSTPPPRLGSLPPTGWTPPPAEGRPEAPAIAPVTMAGVDPRLATWAAHRRAELRAHVDPRPYQAWNPLQFIPRITNAMRDAHLPLSDARLTLVEVETDEALRRATGEFRFVLGLLTSQRILYRAAVRSKRIGGLADGMARGLSILDGIVGVGPAPTLGDPRFESVFDVAVPSAQEGNAALPYALRQLLVAGGFHGALELRRGAFAVLLAEAVRFDPVDLDKLVDAAARIYGALVA